jgi:transposase
VSDIEELKRQGLCMQAISKLTGFDRKTICKYLLKPEGTPVYGPRPPRATKLYAFKPFIEERLKAGVWNAWVLLRELRARAFSSGYTILEDWLHRPWRCADLRLPRANTGGLGTPRQIDIDGHECKLKGFTSRWATAEQ